MRAMFLAAMVLVGPVYAVDVHTCTGPSGEKVFQNEPCAGEKAKDAKLYGTYDKTRDAPSEQYVPSRDPSNPAYVPPPSQRSTLENADPVALQQTPPTAGYSCHDGKRSWIQTTQCPPSTMHHESVAVDATDARTGLPIHGTASMPIQQKVDQRALTHDELCASINANEHVGEKKLSDGADSYERNKLRTANSCGR